MRRLRIFAVCFLLLGSAAVEFVWTSPPSNSVSRAMAERVHHRAGRSVDLTEVAAFSWERVFIFAPYTLIDDIDRSIGFRWAGLRLSSIELNDGVNLVVFVRDGVVVCWFEHPRADGDLVSLANKKGYSRADAKFKVNVDRDHWITLVK